MSNEKYLRVHVGYDREDNEVEKWVMIPHGVDMEEFVKAESAKALIERWGLGEVEDEAAYLRHCRWGVACDLRDARELLSMVGRFHTPRRRDGNNPTEAEKRKGLEDEVQRCEAVLAEIDARLED